jgi:glycosyltransferase involved in cell wall biosynthesis
MPNVAVIIPSFNNARTVRDAVDSALTQAGVNVEVVVVDDGSSDGSYDALTLLGNRIRLVRQRNAGACVARNRGLVETTAPFVKFLDADDVLEPGCLAAQLAQAQRAGRDTVIFGRCIWVTPQGTQIGHYPPGSLPDGAQLSAADLVEASPLTSCPLHRRELLEMVGGFDPSCPRGQEHDLHVRLALSGVTFIFRDTLCYRYIQHESATRISAHQGRRAVCAAQIEIYERQVALAVAGGLISAGASPLRLAFARHFWRHGRVCARFGHYDLTTHCFARSDEIAGGRGRCAVGSLSYRALVRLLGGKQVEWLVNRYESLLAQEVTRRC